MILSDKNKFEFEIRNIGGSDVYYKRNVGDKLWLFSTKEEFELNKNIMDKKYSESAIKKGTEIEMEHAQTIKKFMRDDVSVKEVARAIAIDHLEESPTYYEDLKEEYSKGGGVDYSFYRHRGRKSGDEKLPEIFFIIKHSKAGELKLGNDFTHINNEYYVNNFDSFKKTINKLLEYLGSEESEHLLSDFNSEFTIEEVIYDGKSIDEKGKSLLKYKSIFKISAKKVKELKDKYRFADGGGVSDKIECHNPKCDWSWSVESGGDDLYVCHKCHTDNEKFYVKGGLIAPNGKPSNLTPKQYKLVRKPEFKAWFGDWENDPENASKVVDANGEPMQMYHNTDNNKFTIFDKEKLGDSSGWETAYLGFYFGNKYEKGAYGKKTIKCFLNIKNPFLIKTEYYADFDREYKRKSEPLLMDDFFNKNKYDGILIDVDKLQLGETMNKVFVAFEPNQIKLSDGTNTTFDGNNPDIRFAGGGDVNELKNYFHNIRLDEYYMENEIMDDDVRIEQYKANFGRNGNITYRIYPDEKGNVFSSIYVSSIDRGTLDYGVVQSIEGKKDSRGEGAKAIASLFLLYPNINSVHYEDESYFDNESKSFWEKIGGSSSELLRSDFFTYFENKFGYNPNIRYAGGGNVEDLISQGIVELKMFATKPEHAKEYGLDSINPLYVQSLNVNENKRLKGVGKKVLQYIDDYAIKNGHDVVFGHINQKATMKKDNRTGYFTEFTDIDFIKHWLFRNGYSVNQENNDFHKVVMSDSKDINDESKSDIRLDDRGKIQLNSNKGKVNLKLSSYEDVTELVPVSELLKLREFDRNERPKYSLEDSKDNISKLEKALVENGVEEPLIIEYSLADNSVLLIEGNHRLNVAENLGFDYLPARVVLRRREFSPLQKTKAFKVKGFTPDKYGYVPSDLKPSQVGIGGTTKAFEDGGIVEGQLHSECNEETGCGEKYDVGGVGHIIEVERDEAVIVSKAFQDNSKYEIKGTLSEIASALNVLGDGKNFDSGAEIKSEDGKKVEVAEIKKEAKNTDVETIDPNSIIINRRSMYDKEEYVAKGTPKEIASQINNLNDNGVKITDGGSIKKT